MPYTLAAARKQLAFAFTRLPSRLLDLLERRLVILLPFTSSARTGCDCVMSASERTPLLSSQAGGSGAPSTSRLPSTTSAPTTHPRPTLSAPVPNSAAGLILTEDDIAIEGMVLALLAELSERGYVVPPGLPTLPPDMPHEEADAEIAFLRSVFGVPRHRRVLDKYLPDLSRNAGGNGAASGGANGFSTNGAETPVLPGSIMSTNRPAVTPTGRRGGPLAHSSSSASSLSNASTSSSHTLPARPSPLSSQVLDTTVITSPSALFLAALLSLLISLQAEYRGSVEETDPGVDGELRMFKARRELGERMYAVVEGLLDSYLVTGDARHHHQGEDDDDDEDALVTLLFRDFPLHYDSMDRATCCESRESSPAVRQLTHYSQPSTSSLPFPPLPSSKPKTSSPTLSSSQVPSTSGETDFCQRRSGASAR